MMTFDITFFNQLSNLGDKLKFLRRSAGVTRAEMSLQCGFGVSTIKLWENSTNIVEISAVKLMSYLQFLQKKGIYITIDTLLKGYITENIDSTEISENKSTSEEGILSLVNTSLGLELLNSSKVLFYANLYQKIKYFNFNYSKEVMDITFIESPIDHNVTNLIPITEIPKWNLVIQKINEGISTDYVLPIKDDCFINLLIIPNITFESKVIGFAALHR